MRYFITVLLLVVLLSASGQKIRLINSGDILSTSRIHIDSGKYELAIQELLSIPPVDTNYMVMRTVLAEAYLGAKRYDKVIDVCDSTLSGKTPYRAQMMKLKALSLERDGKIPESVAIMEAALRDYPFDIGLHFNLGVVYYKAKDYQRAIDAFFRVVEINPFHSGSHRNLAIIAEEEGMKTHSALANGIYLGLNNTDNARLVLVDKLLSNQSESEGKLNPISINGCERLDQILKARIALEDNFKSKFNITWPVVRQYEILFTQLNVLKKNSDDKWIDYYLPIFEAIRDTHSEEAFVYHIITSANNEEASKWRQKHEKELGVFYSAVNEKLKEVRLEIGVPENLGLGANSGAIYGSGNLLDAVGRMDVSDKKTGRWIYFYDNGEKSAEGSYGPGEVKTGVWSYYHDNGTIKSIEDYATGEVTVYHRGGGKHQHFFLKDDKIDGTAELYYPCGAVMEVLTYKNGLRQGSGQSYYRTGQPQLTFSYRDDDPDGDFVEYYENGKLYVRKSFSEGLLTGPYVEYYPTGKPMAKGSYDKNMMTGLWEYYYPNGKMAKQGRQEKGIGVGEWLFYDPTGTISEKRTLDTEGNIVGESLMYDEGVLFCRAKYQKGTLVSLTYIDKSGKTVGQYGGKDGTFQGSQHNPSGTLVGKGNYVAGKHDGPWTFYFPTGKKSSDYIYKGGRLHGLAVDYYKSGMKKYQCMYDEGEADGYYEEWYITGQLKREGWRVNGLSEQRWLSYYPDGKLESDYFYLRDNLVGNAIDYNTDGKILTVHKYADDNSLGDIESYTSHGGKYHATIVEEGRISTILHKSPNGSALVEGTLTCGKLNGSWNTYYPDKQPLTTSFFLNGRREGAYKYYGVKGNVLVDGAYVYGQANGKWTYYHENGKLSQEGTYVNGERDSTYTYYDADGSVTLVAQYRNDKRVGVAKYYAPDKSLMYEKTYEDGEPVAFRVMTMSGAFSPWTGLTDDVSIVSYYTNGNKSSEHAYKDGLLNGPDRTFFPDGRLANEYFYKDGDYEGPFSYMYSNGKVFRRGTYHLDELTGLIETFDRDGNLISTAFNVMGKMNGKVTFYEKGVMKREFMYWSDKPEE